MSQENLREYVYEFLYDNLDSLVAEFIAWLNKAENDRQRQIKHRKNLHGPKRPRGRPKKPVKSQTETEVDTD